MMKIQNPKNSNIKIKVACLFFAFFMWVYVMSDLDPIDTRDINGLTVSVSNLSELDSNNLTLSPEQILKANVQIKGRRTLIAKKIKSGIKLQANIQDAKIGNNSVKITVVGDNTDLNYTIIPANLNINLEEKIAVEKKISIKSIGSLMSNYYIDTIKLSKNTVYVSGASSLIELIDKVEVELNLDNNYQDFSKLSNIKILDSNSNEISGLTLDNPNVILSVSLKKEKIVPIKANIKTDVQNLNISEFSLNPNTVKIQGLAKDIDAISEIETSQILLSDLSNNNITNIELNVPNNIHSSIKSVGISSKIEKVIEQKDYEFEYSIDEIEILNSEGNSYIINNNMDNVKFNFSSTDEVKKEDIKLFIDTENMSNNTVSISYTTNKEIDAVIINPDNVELIADNSTQ